MPLPMKVKVLMVTSKSAGEADNVLKEKVPGWEDFTFVGKMLVLNNNFRFSMGSRYTHETDPEKIAREDYYASLAYLISEAREFGIESTFRNSEET